MISAVITFALLSAVLELILLLKWAPASLLEKPVFTNTVHIVVAALNLAIHFGTIVGTMTAITAALVSFVTVPAALWIKTFWKNWKATAPVQS